MNFQKLNVLLIGDVAHHELRPAVERLCDAVGPQIVRTVDEALDADAIARIAWHAIVLAVSRPGQITPRDQQRIGRAFPLAHQVALLGSLCEGETRSGHPHPGITRIFWHQFLNRCDSQAQLVRLLTNWRLPRTASEVERTEAQLQKLPPGASGLVAIVTRDASQFDAVSAACRAAGYATAWAPREDWQKFRGATAMIWDGTTQGRIQFDQLSRLHTQLHDTPIIALMSFPRWDQVQQALSNGARRVVSCPFLLHDLWNALASVGSVTS